MSTFRLDRLSPDEFEDLVWRLCQRLLGAGTEKFRKGKDGGKDARFEGVAERLPSRSSPFRGKIVVQAKHTGNPIASVSDSDVAAILSREAPKIKKLFGDKEMDHYLCFTNRRKTGVAGSDREKKLREQSGVSSCFLYGLETIESWLGEYPEIVDDMRLREARPPIINPVQLEKLLTRLAAEDHLFDFEGGRGENEQDFRYPGLEAKNRINELSEEAFAVIREDSMAHFKLMDQILKNPRNRNLAKHYRNIAANFRGAFTSRRGEFDKFEEIFDFIHGRLVTRPAMEDMGWLIYCFLHYMYCECDLGRRAERGNIDDSNA